MDTTEIRRRLRNIRTRADMIDALVDAGEAHIDAVLPLLQDRNDGVRWSAIKILSEIGDARAVGPLVVLLEQSKNATDAAYALRAITGRDLGDDAREWREWASQQSDRGAAHSLGILADGDLVKAATKGLPVTVSGEKQEYTVKVSLPGARSQEVWIDLSRKDPGGQPIVQLSTPCGDAVESQYESALKLNMSIPYGAVALATLGDRLCFAMVDTYLRATVHPEDISKSIMSLAQQGDSIEAALSNVDTF